MLIDFYKIIIRMDDDDDNTVMWLCYITELYTEKCCDGKFLLMY